MFYNSVQMRCLSYSVSTGLSGGLPTGLTSFQLIISVGPVFDKKLFMKHFGRAIKRHHKTKEKNHKNLWSPANELLSNVKLCWYTF